MTSSNGQQYAAVYARVSTTDQADKGYSLPTQIEACHTFAAREGYTVPESHVFVDDYTGMSLHRPALTKLRELVRMQAVSAMIVHDLDRLSRKLAHQLLLSEELEQAGVVLHIVTMPDGAKTPETQLLVNVRGIIAEYERAKILERTARGRRGRAKAGFVPGGRRTFGYTYVKHPDKGAHYAVHAEEAAIVQRIFQLYVTGGLSQWAIAEKFTQEGIPTPATLRADSLRRLPVRTWHQSTIAKMLRNTAYIGTLYDGKSQRLPGKGNPDKKTRQRGVPRDEWIAIPVPPLIDIEIFHAAQAQKTRNTQQSKRNRKVEYLFVGGRLRCGQCGRSMPGSVNGHGLRSYHCTRPPFQDVIAPHTRRSVQATRIEPWVWQAVERVLNNPTRIAQEVERRTQGVETGQGDLDRERHTYERQLAQCAKDIKRWEAAYLGEAIDLADFKGKKAEVDARRASLELELARLDDQQRLLEQATLETATLTEYCQRVRDNLTQFDTAEKRLALAALNITVVWHPDNPPNIQGSIPVAIANTATG
jgi:site-specific DNA recombinase